MSAQIFVYGTLRPGQVNYPAVRTAVVEHVAAQLGDHALKARLTARFPYGTPAPGFRVVGDLLLLKDGTEKAVLDVLDALEGFNARARRPATCHYLRFRRTVITTSVSTFGAAGTPVQAWVYLAGPAVALEGMDQVTDGDWTSRRTPVGRW